MLKKTIEELQISNLLETKGIFEFQWAVCILFVYGLLRNCANMHAESGQFAYCDVQSAYLREVVSSTMYSLHTLRLRWQFICLICHR